MSNILRHMTFSHSQRSCLLHHSRPGQLVRPLRGSAFSAVGAICFSWVFWDHTLAGTASGLLFHVCPKVRLTNWPQLRLVCHTALGQLWLQHGLKKKIQPSGSFLKFNQKRNRTIPVPPFIDMLMKFRKHQKHRMYLFCFLKLSS